MSDTELKITIPEGDRAFLARPQRDLAHEIKQRKLMLGSLCLLLVALSIVIWHEREFWFPEESDADADQPAEMIPATKLASQPTASAPANAPAAKPKHQAAAQ